MFGDSHDEVLRALGPPLGRGTRLRGTFRDPAVRRTVERLAYPGSDTRVRYLYSDGFPKTVTFHIESGRVHRIDWEYWLD